MTAEGLNSSQVGSSSAGGVLTLLHGHQELLAMASVDRIADIIDSELRAQRGTPRREVQNRDFGSRRQDAHR